MKIQSIENNQSRIDFRSHHHHDNDNNIEKASAFVNMDDNQLKNLAATISYDKEAQNKHKKSLFGLFCTIPIVDTIASAIVPTLRTETGNLARVEGASLGARAISASRTAGIWGIGLGTIAVYNVAKNALTSHSKSVKHFEQDNPSASFLVDMGAIFGGFLLAQNGIYHLDNKLQEKMPKTAEKINSKAEKALMWLENTKFNKKTLPSLHESANEMAKAMPNVAKIGKGIIRNSALILIGVGLYKLFSYSKKEHEKIDQNFHTLKNAQFKTAKYLTNAMSIERDVLAQDQPKTAKVLHKEMSQALPIEEF